MQHTWRRIMHVGAAALTVVLAATTVPAAAQTTGGAQAELSAMADSARTSVEHAAVARQYRLRAETFAAQATEHEANVRRLSRNAGPLAHKWPALAGGGIQKEKDQAVAARRASEESRRLADHHIRMSVESLTAQR